MYPDAVGAVLEIGDRVVEETVGGVEHKEVEDRDTVGGSEDKDIRARVAGEPIAPRAAVERVPARAAFEQVVPRAALELVVAIVAGEPVGMAGTGQVLDIGHNIALGMADLSDAGGKVHRDPRIGARVNRPVATIAAVERIRTRTAFEPVVPGPTGEHIRARQAEEPVIASQTLDKVGLCAPLDRIVPVGASAADEESLP